LAEHTEQTIELTKRSEEKNFFFFGRFVIFFLTIEEKGISIYNYGERREIVQRRFGDWRKARSGNLTSRLWNWRLGDSQARSSVVNKL